MAKSKPKKTAAKPAKAKAAKPKPKAKAVKAKAQPKAVKAAKPKKAAPKAKAKATKPTAAKAAPKPKAVKKATKPKAKPKAAAATVDPTLAIVVIKPEITAPGDNSNHDATTDLVITAATNDTTVRYRILVTDVSGSPPFPAPTVINVPSPGVSPFNATVPRATFAAGKTYEIKLIVHPSDGATPPNEAGVIHIFT